jgi:hypothetical protein
LKPVKSPEVALEARDLELYVAGRGDVRLMSSGLVPVSTVCRTGAGGFLEVRMKSGRAHPGMPLTGRADGLPAVPANGMLATGVAAVISRRGAESGVP